MNDMILEHERLRVVVDSGSGALREITHKPARLALIAQPEAAALRPFMIILTDGTTLRSWVTCTLTCDEAGTVHVRWILNHGLRLEARLRIDPHSGELYCWVELSNPEKLPVAAVAYPYLTGIARLGDVPDWATYPNGTSWCIRMPPVSWYATRSTPCRLPHRKQ